LAAEQIVNKGSLCNFFLSRGLREGGAEVMKGQNGHARPVERSHIEDAQRSIFTSRQDMAIRKMLVSLTVR
jgi:hypothetical protein